jgi:D-arabinose 1-dehydrogenase-like Zn-dependent alcohol dehydrogenase
MWEALQNSKRDIWCCQLDQPALFAISRSSSCRLGRVKLVAAYDRFQHRQLADRAAERGLAEQPQRLCAGYTVWSGLRWADPKPGERVAVIGIGGLGHLAVQYAKAAGFETIAVSRSPDKDRLIREIGADAIVRDGESLSKAGGADVVLGTSNSADAMADAIKGLRPDGRLVVMGFEPKPLPLSIGDLIMRRIRVLGSQQNGREYLY